MHARLTVSERQKIEKDIAAQVSKLSEAVTCGDQRIKELEGLLEQQNKELAKAAADAGTSADRVRELESSVAALKDELNSRNADISVLKLEIKSLTKEGDALNETIAEYGSTDEQLRARIEELEQMLIVERRKTGQELMSRILELEAMLSVERQRVAEMPEIVDVSKVESRSKKAANSKSIKETKENLAKKMG